MQEKTSEPPGRQDKLWDDWRWQIRNRITTSEELEKYITPDEHERAALDRGVNFSLTPHYARLLKDNAAALRRLVIPTDFEAVMSPGEEADPLHEDIYRPVPGIIHRYPHKALLMATSFCSLKCRYCTRSRLVSEDLCCATAGNPLEEALNYLRCTPEIRDVLISGGDPLTLSDAKIEHLLAAVSEIDHVDFIRIGTKTPVVLPQRFTPSLIKILKKYHPWLSLHFIHPAELSPETVTAVNKLADAGVPLGSQTVLLKGVNDDPAVLQKLFTELIKNRVRPYYLYQCDPIPGSAHFRTPVETGLDIMRYLLGRTTGYAIPQFVVDTCAGGKVPLLPNYTVGKDDTTLRLQGFDGSVTDYPRVLK